MRNDMRPELSQKNPYWIGKHRYWVSSKGGTYHSPRAPLSFYF